jgi:hypothetical protein
LQTFSLFIRPKKRNPVSDADMNSRLQIFTATSWIPFITPLGITSRSLPGKKLNDELEFSLKTLRVMLFTLII